MLTDGRITCFNSISRPTRSRRLFSLRGSFVPYVGRNMLFYPIPQSLFCGSYLARITLALTFINNGTFLVGRNAILFNGWKGSTSPVNNTRIDREETFSYGLPNLTLGSMVISNKLGTFAGQPLKQPKNLRSSPQYKIK